MNKYSFNPDEYSHFPDTTASSVIQSFPFTSDTDFLDPELHRGFGVLFLPESDCAVRGSQEVIGADTGSRRYRFARYRHDFLPASRTTGKC